MSLINQMLKDLEQRNVPAGEIKPLAGDVRTVQSAGRKVSPQHVLLLAGALLIAAAGIWWKFLYNPVQRPAPTAMKPAHPHAAPVVPPLPAPAVAAVPAAMPESTGRLPGLDTELRTVPMDRPRTEKRLESSAAVVPSEPVAVPGVSLAEDKPREVRLGKSLPASSGAALKSVSPAQKSENLYKQAVAMIQQGRVSEARSTLELALQDNLANHNARQLLVSLLVENKRSAEALNLLRDGVRIAPDQTGFVMALARLQIEAGDRDAALQTMELGAKYAAEDADFHGFYAALLQQGERHEESVAHYLKALGADPANTSWLVGVGISLQALDKFADARDAFERARQVGQLSPELAAFVDQRLRQLSGK